MLVYKAKMTPNTVKACTGTAAEPKNVDPLNGKQQGVLDVDVDGPAAPVRHSWLLDYVLYTFKALCHVSL